MKRRGNESGVRVSNEGPLKNIRRTFYRLLIEKILIRSRRKQAEVSLAFVSDRTIRGLNRRYRGKDRPTDVLSFDLSLQKTAPAAPSAPFALSAEIIISSETASRQAVENGHSLHRELSRLVIHGLLHALGYDHEKPEEEKRMVRRERFFAGLYLGPARSKKGVS